ncbi:hypothetical protein BWQ96_10542 [Gracilariopsis chorda]|uniref:Uncharacterized protein n=1 Tax=Gracilariopsis chorda TaxID=448386 RepID=A0A2V3ICC8_9FLOR|nr:hypothetical protein BWQ96_10542 [Gracilariopsis chorda]|eukprot:PXF39756.1 hypothetical protein BWQ96_10542 [Gracilariopsis chorda]
MESRPAGTADDPVFTEQVQISAGVAFVIGAAGASVVLSQAVLRSWRRVSLSQVRGLLLARIQLLVLVFAAVVGASIAGSRRLFPEDARALGGILPILGVLAPFVFLARRPDELTHYETSPTRTKILDWFLQSPTNALLAVPGIICVALCAWGMVVSKSWDVLALAFAFLIAVLARSDPLQYFAWDGVGVKWQWGRLLPCPTRMPSWRFVIGRVEESDGSVGVEVDAMETPSVDTLRMRGGLFGETPTRSDRSLAQSIIARGVLASMPQFYDYVNGVWVHIIAGGRGGRMKEGRLLDEAAASCFILIVSMLREALNTNARLGADVWLLLSIFRIRLNDIAADYTYASNYQRVPALARLRLILNDMWSVFAGRRRGAELVLDDAAVVQLERSLENKHSSKREEVQGSVDLEKGPDEELDNVQMHVNDTESGPQSEPRETQGLQPASKREAEWSRESQSGEEQSGVGTDLDHAHTHYSVLMYQALDLSERPPTSPHASEWADWIVQCLSKLYAAAIRVSRDGGNVVSENQSAHMEARFADWMGAANMVELKQELRETFEGEALRNRNEEGVRCAVGENVEETLLVSELAAQKVQAEEAFTYMMLSLAMRNISGSVHFDNGGVGFESAGIDVCGGELNGRLKSQNVAYKLMIAQMALWTYVGLGETVTALLAR